MPPVVSIEDLEYALYWVSASEYDNSAFVSRTTGQVYSYGPDGAIDPDAPDDTDDGVEYLAIPSKKELNLGQELVRSFVGEHAPQLQEDVHRLFRQRGAYARYKVLLQRQNLLERWHSYEGSATLRALSQWAEEHGFAVKRESDA
jgi:hypothetical protein